MWEGGKEGVRGGGGTSGRFRSGEENKAERERGREGAEKGRDRAKESSKPRRKT